MNNIKLLIVLLSMLIPFACYAHAGMYDGFRSMMDVLYAVLKTIFVSQLVVFVLIRFNWLKTSKSIRKRLLFLAKRLCKNWYINLLAAWALSSFVLTPYIYVFSMAAFILAIIPFFIFGVLYWVVVFRKKMRKRWLSGMKAIYFYLIASIGQIVGFIVYFFAYIIMWYTHWESIGDFLRDLYCYRFYLGEDGGYLILKSMLELSVCFAIPYLLLITRKALKSYSQGL